MFGKQIVLSNIAHRPPFDQSFFFQVADTRPVPRSAQRMAQGRTSNVVSHPAALPSSSRGGWGVPMWVWVWMWMWMLRDMRMLSTLPPGSEHANRRVPVVNGEIVGNALNDIACLRMVRIDVVRRSCIGRTFTPWPDAVGIATTQGAVRFVVDDLSSEQLPL
jgi:hypothetical protein